MFPGPRTLATIKEELEVARQEAAQALDSLCAERESRVQDALQLRDAIPLEKHQEALTAVAQQLAQTEKELQTERALREHAQTELARLESELRVMQKDSVNREEHEKVKVRLTLLSKASAFMLYILTARVFPGIDPMNFELPYQLFYAFSVLREPGIDFPTFNMS